MIVSRTLRFLIHRFPHRFLIDLLQCSLLCFILCLALGGHQAQAESKIEKSPESERKNSVGFLLYIHPLNISTRYEMDESQNLQRLDHHLYGIGLEFKSFELTFEVNQFSTFTQLGNISVSREQSEYHFWGRMPIFKWEFVDIFGGAAVGSYDEKIKTSLSMSSAENKSVWNWSTGASLGLNFHLYRYLLTSIEVRTMFGKDFDPQPQYGGLLRVGLRYN